MVVVFRTRLRQGIDERQLGDLGEAMYAIAASMPGFLSYKDFAAADGENISIVEFESPEALAAWRERQTTAVMDDPSNADEVARVSS